MMIYHVTVIWAAIFICCNFTPLHSATIDTVEDDEEAFLNVDNFNVSTIPTSIDMTTASRYSISFETGPTVIPTPVPSPYPTYYVQDKDTNIVCVMVQIQAQFRIPYTLIDDTTVHAQVTFDSTKSRASGQCSNSTQTVNIEWRPSTMLENVSDWWSLQFTFQRLYSSNDIAADDNSTTQSSRYSLSSIRLLYVIEEGTFVNSKTHGKHADVLNVDVEKFSTAVNSTFHCTTEDIFDFPTTSLSMYTTNLKLQAFRSTNDTVFSHTGTHCPKDAAINTIVPIAVGVLLILQVILVIVAYFITHRARVEGERKNYEQF